MPVRCWRTPTPVRQRYCDRTRLNVRQTEALARQAPKAEQEAIKAPRDNELVRLERDLATRLGLKVKIEFNGKGGSLRLDYRSLDQFDTLMRLLSPEKASR